MTDYATAEDRRYRYTDLVGETLEIRPATNRPGMVVIDCDPDGAHPPVIVPASRFAEVAGAIYFHGGQPVPDLPVIQDDASVDALAVLLASVLGGHGGGWAHAARALLARGVRMPEVTP